MLLLFVRVEGIALTIILSVSCAPKIETNDSSVEKDRIVSFQDNSQKLSKKFYAELEKKNILIGDDGMMRNLTCEHFDEATCDNVDKQNCHQNITCPGRNEFCFTSWKLFSKAGQSEVSLKAEATTETNLQSSSVGSVVKKMGCMNVKWQVHQCQKNCVHANKDIQKHGHLYCCCTGMIFCR